jgi:GxxExxY protein
VDAEEVAREIVDSALKVHRALGPGLLESAYQACLAYELRKRGHRVDCELPMTLEYDGTRIDVGYRLDMRVNGTVIVENKTVEEILPIHHAQVLTYLRLSGISLGFLINWNVTLLRDGLKRVVLNHPYSPMSSKTRKVEEDTTLSPE